jgi:hypothetical protein
VRGSGALALTLLLACGPPPDGAPRSADPESTGTPWFEEVAAEVGLDFVHRSGHDGRFLMPEIMGGGAALVDLDGDGDLDVYLVQGGDLRASRADRPGNRLYRNRGDGTFEDVTAGSGADDRGYGMGVAAGDVDGDGDLDLYVTNVGPDVLLRNEGGGRFTDVTAAAGLGDPGWGASAAFFDPDLDGDLDLFVTRYLDWSIDKEIDCYSDFGAPDYCSPQSYDAPVPDLFYRNLGDGTFRDDSAVTGIADVAGTGLGAVVADFDGDGAPELFVANDGMPDRLWFHRPDGTFEDRALLAGCAVDLDGKAKAGMGVTVADLDFDGDPDLLVCNLHQESDSLFRNDGGTFTDATAVLGLGAVSRPFTRFGMGWVDFDDDGHLDLFQANGRVALHATRLADDPFAEPNLLFHGLPGGGFEEVIPRGGTARPLLATSRAAAFGDVDGDGGVDVLIVNRDAPVHLLRNVVPDRGRWIAFDVLDRSGAPALGATLTLRAGDRTVVHEIHSASSYLTANPPRVHLGLGHLDRVTDVRVRWGDGGETAFGNHGAGRIVTLKPSTPSSSGGRSLF